MASPIDVSLTTGGQPPSRSRRTRATPVDTGRVTQRSRDFPHEVSVVAPPTTGALDGINRAVGRFFPELMAHEERQELDEIRQENAEEVARLEAEVRKDHKAAREAVRTGDFAKFIPDSDFRSRRVIVNAFKQITARQMAHEDVATVREQILSTPADGDPRDVVQKFLQDNLKGADPIFSHEYSSELDRLAQRAIAEHRAAREELVQTQAERRGLELIKGQIKEGEIPPTAQGLEALRSQLIGALPMPGPQAVLRTDALIDNLIINLAAEGDSRALRLAQLPDPSRDGTSVVTRHPGKMEEAVRVYSARKNAVRSVKARSELESFEDRLALINAGRAPEGDSLESLWVDIWTHRERHGDSERWDALRDHVSSMIGSAGIERGNIHRIARGLMPNVSDAEWNKLASKLLDGSALADLQAEGLTEEAARNRVFQVIANRGSGKRVRDIHSSRLLGSTDAAEVTETFTRLAAIDRATDRPMQGNHLSEDAASLYHLMVWAQNSGRDPLAIRAQYLEALGANQGEVNPEDHLARRLEKPGRNDSIVLGRAGVSEQAKKLWDELDIPEFRRSFAGRFDFGLGAARKVAGALPETVAGVVGGGVTGAIVAGGAGAVVGAGVGAGAVIASQFTDDPFDSKIAGYEDLPRVAQERLERALNVASFMLSTTPASLDEIRALAGEMVQGEFGLELGPNGKPSVTLDQTPPVALGNDGIPIPGAHVTPATLERAKEALEEPEAARMMAAIGDLGGLAQDNLTAAGYGLAVRSMAAGFPQDILLVPGQRLIVPAGELPEDLPLSKFLAEVSRDDSAVAFAVPSAPSDDPNNSIPRRVYLTKHERGSGKGNLFMAFDDRRGGWTLRYEDTGSRRMTLEELSAKNKAARRPPPKSDQDLSTLSLRELKELAGKGNLDATAEIGRRAEQGKAPVGSPVPASEGRGEVTDEEARAVKEAEGGALTEFVARGVVTPAAALELEDSGNLSDKTQRALNASQDEGHFLDDVTKPIGKRFMSEASDFLEENEGRSAFAYDDATGRRLRPGQKAKGNPTVAIGFNLNRPDAKELIEKVGADYAAVREGRQPLTRAQQDKLTALAVRKVVNWLRDHFKGVKLENHRLMALASLAYNSRWGENGPTLIGPKLTKAIKEGRWQDAAREIEANSMGGIPKHLRLAIRARREREARMFLGTFQ